MCYRAPPGASCDAARGSNFSLCPAGTYQRSAWRRTACRACPIGTFCPSRGQQHPWDCAPGMVCSQRGLKFPNSLCPPGHFCPPGVQTLDPTSSLIQRPMECPENTWCASGVVMNTSIAGNFSTPQPCLNGFVCFRGSDSPQGSGPCPTGSYCPPNMLPIICPPAMYCPGVGNLFPSLCTPGYYNDLEGQNACIGAPLGISVQLLASDDHGLAQQVGIQHSWPSGPCVALPCGLLLLAGDRDGRLEYRDTASPYRARRRHIAWVASRTTSPTRRTTPLHNRALMARCVPYHQ